MAVGSCACVKGVKGKRWNINKSVKPSHGTYILERGLNYGCIMEITSQNRLRSHLYISFLVQQVILDYPKTTKSLTNRKNSPWVELAMGISLSTQIGSQHSHLISHPKLVSACIYLINDSFIQNTLLIMLLFSVLTNQITEQQI